MSLYRALLMSVILSLSLHAAGQSTGDIPSTISNVSDVTRERVRSFLVRFIDPGKSAADQAAMFTEDAQYYKRGAIGREAIIRDIEYTARRWQWRKFKLLSIDDVKRDIDASADRVFVTYKVAFEVSSPSRNISGVAAYKAAIADLSTQPRVEAIEEQVLSRNQAFTLTD